MKEDILVSKNRVKVFLQQNGVRTSVGAYKALGHGNKGVAIESRKRAKREQTFDCYGM